MKRTIIFLAILSIVFLFSGCDNILEGFFPNVTGGGDKEGNNTIEVNIGIDWQIVDSPEYRDCQKPVIIELQQEDFAMPGNWITVQVRDRWCSGDWFNEMFEWLPDGNYRVIVYFDRDYTWSLTPGDDNVFAYDWQMYGSQTVQVQGGGWYLLDAYLMYYANDVLGMP
jgi:hypothetical protein